MRSRSWSLLILSLVAALALAPAHASGGGGKDAKKKAHGGSSASAPKAQRQLTSLQSWVGVAPLSVTVIQEDSIRGKVSFSFGMDVPDEKLRARTELLMPRLRDAWLSRLGHYASTTMRPNRPANIDDVSRVLQLTADDVLGGEGSRVLISSVIVDVR
jgi:hypothetical protein